jgi:hypothetical protein
MEAQKRFLANAEGIYDFIYNCAIFIEMKHKLLFIFRRQLLRYIILNFPIFNRETKGI